MGRHFEAGVDSSPWAFKLLPFNDELLSSFLVRTSHAHGMTPHKFCRIFLPSIEIWTRDIDRSASFTLIERIARSGGLTVIDVRAMTLPTRLLGFESMFSHHPCLSWINALGIFHRSRRRFGLQYCPQCLGETPAFVCSWRMSFSFACARHHSFLLDRCRSCASAIAPHRHGFDLTKCHHCGASLATSLVKPLTDPDFLRLLDLQLIFERWAENEHVEIGTSLTTREDFFAGAMIILQALKAKMRTHPELHDHDSNYFSFEQLHLINSKIRGEMCMLLHHVLTDWPSNLLHFGSATGMTQVGFRHHGRLPAWVNDVVEQMPLRLRNRHHWSSRKIGQRVRDIESSGGTQCRSARAELLMAAAGARA